MRHFLHGGTFCCFRLPGWLDNWHLPGSYPLLQGNTSSSKMLGIFNQLFFHWKYSPRNQSIVLSFTWQAFVGNGTPQTAAAWDSTCSSQQQQQSGATTAVSIESDAENNLVHRKEAFSFILFLSIKI
jgi:hypothetical protein